MKTKLVTFFILDSFLLLSAFGGSATWNLDPMSGDWTKPANWTPATVPNDPNDIATFGTSNVTNVFTAGEFIKLNSIIFNPNASAFTISVETQQLTVSGIGIVNNSGVTQNFVVTPGGIAEMIFAGSANAGNSTVFTNQGGGISAAAVTYFFDDASAGNASFVNQAATQSDRPQPGGTIFFDNATAGNGRFLNQGSRASNAPGNAAFFDNSTAANGYFICDDAVGDDGVGGSVQFSDTATAGDATFILSGTNFDGARGAFITFLGTSTAGNATIIAKSGTTAGGTIYFRGTNNGGSSQVILRGNGSLDLNYIFVSAAGVGSLQGNGLVSLSSHNLSIGTNGQNTIFSGLITDDRQGGSITKVGTGTLTLGGANTYSGGTTVEAGELVVDNSVGSATGSGPLKVNAGVLGGRGFISGNVTVGTDNGPGAALRTAINTRELINLVIRGSLTLKSDASFQSRLHPDRNQADRVTANGVTIGDGAMFGFIGQRFASLPEGSVFTVIDNQSSTPISGHFTNLPDGGTITYSVTSFQANYEGGNGNDLTLTVVP